MDSESGGPSLPTGVHSDMTDLDNIDSVLKLPECVGFGAPGLPCLSGKIPPESGSLMVVSDFASDVDSESGGPSLPMGVHSDMTDYDDIDSVSQMTECVGFGDPGLPCSSGKIPPESGYVTAMSDFASVVDSEPNEPSLPSGVHLDMPDYAVSDSVSQVLDCVNFGKPRSGTTSPESGCVMAMSDFAGDVEHDEPSLPSGVHLVMPDCAAGNHVSQVSDCVNFGKPGSGTTTPESGCVTVMSDFASDVEPDEPSLPSGVHLVMPDCAAGNSVSQVSDCVHFGKPRSGTTSPESGCVTAMSDFASEVDSEPDEPSLPSGVHLDMPDFADSDGVPQVSDYVNFGEPRSGATSPESGSITAMSDFVTDFDPGPGGPLQGLAVIFDRQNFSNC